MDYVKAGYTHVIKYKTIHEDYGVMDSEFPTVTDAVEFWVNSINSNPKAFDPRVVELVGAS
ncbi:MAG: hypothetical protein AB7U63_17910 [Porticoccaceae bacterium]